MLTNAEDKLSKLLYQRKGCRCCLGVESRTVQKCANHLEMFPPSNIVHYLKKLLQNEYSLAKSVSIHPRTSSNVSSYIFSSPRVSSTNIIYHIEYTRFLILRPSKAPICSRICMSSWRHNRSSSRHFVQRARGRR